MLGEKHKIKNYNDFLVDFLKKAGFDSVNCDKCHTLIHDREKPIENCPLKASVKSDTVEDQIIYESRFEGYFLIKIYPSTIDDSKLFFHSIIEIPRECPECGDNMELIADDWSENWFFCPECLQTEKAEEMIPEDSDDLDKFF